VVYNWCWITSSAIYRQQPFRVHSSLPAIFLSFYLIQILIDEKNQIKVNYAFKCTRACTCILCGYMLKYKYTTAICQSVISVLSLLMYKITQQYKCYIIVNDPKVGSQGSYKSVYFEIYLINIGVV